MTPQKFHFEKEFELEVNGNYYVASVEGYVVRDELDYNSSYNEFDNITIFDENNERVEDHEDMNEIIQQVMDSDFDVYYEEGSDNYFDCQD